MEVTIDVGALDFVIASYIEMEKSLLVYAFVVLIILFTGFSIWYLIENSFSPETIDLIFPAFGAILLSGYLGYKSIFLDSPLPKTYSVPVAVLFDQHNGMIRGMRPGVVTVNEFLGVSLIDVIPIYPEFQGLHLSEALRDTTGELSTTRTTKIITDIVEYAALEWLRSPSMYIGIQPGFSMVLVQGGGGTTGPLPQDLVSVSITTKRGEQNSLLQARPITIPLPRGSTVTVAREPSNVHTIELKTLHSDVQIRIRFSNAERLGQPADGTVRRIYAALGIPDHPTGLAMYGFEFNFQGSQRSYSRYSVQAKKEAQWLANIQQRLDLDFSWTRLRAFLASQ